MLINTTNNENNGSTQIKISGCMLSIDMGLINSIKVTEILQVMIHSSYHTHIYKGQLKVQKLKE
jgi:hypothetical protein